MASTNTPPGEGDSETDTPKSLPHEATNGALMAAREEQDREEGVPPPGPTEEDQRATPDASAHSGTPSLPQQPSPGESHLEEPPRDQASSGAQVELPSGKDKGYAWVVAVSVCLVNIIAAGYVKSFGVLYILILEYFPDASGAASGWIMGLLVGCRGLLAAVMGALTVLLGPRICVIMGALMIVGGLVAAVPATSIVHIAFTLGAAVGIGLCMSETPGYLVVTDYFEEKRPLANGIRACGNPLGGMLFAPLIVALHQHFGLHGALLMLAGVMSHMIVIGSLMRPFRVHQKFVQAQFRANLGGDALGPDTLRPVSQSQTTKGKKRPLDFKFLKKPSYLVYLVMVVCINAALPNALLYTPVYGRSIGLDAYQNSIIASYTSACDFAMRLLCGWTSSLNIYKPRNGLVAGLMVGGVGCLVTPLCASMWQLLGAATCISFCMAFFWTLLNVLLADQFGGDAMPSTYGFFRMTQGICSFLYPSLIGYVMDVSGGVAAPFLLMGLLLILGGTIFGLQPAVAEALTKKHSDRSSGSERCAI